MPQPFSVQLKPHDPTWKIVAEQGASALNVTLGPTLIVVHHIGSTSIPGLLAKPVLDLLLVVASLDAFDGCRAPMEHLGYEWWGEYGLAGRRYCTKSSPGDGRRLIQLHCWVESSPEIRRHLAFRDYLMRRREIAELYAAEKARCQALHPTDSYSYNDCKDAWIRVVESNALSDAGCARQS